MGTLSPGSHGDTLPLMAAWRRLSAGEQAATLAELFPDGMTYRREDHPETSGCDTPGE